MRKVAPIWTAILVLCLTGCTGRNTFLVNQMDFDEVTNRIFAPPAFERQGGGSSIGGDARQFMALYVPKDPDATMDSDLREWDDFLMAHGAFSGSGESGSPGLYLRRKWANQGRIIVVDAVAMKNGKIRVTYLEALR